jgi:hypothetical protein
MMAMHRLQDNVDKTNQAAAELEEKVAQYKEEAENVSWTDAACCPTVADLDLVTSQENVQEVLADTEQ